MTKNSYIILINFYNIVCDTRASIQVLVEISEYVKTMLPTYSKSGISSSIFERNSFLGFKFFHFYDTKMKL